MKTIQWSVIQRLERQNGILSEPSLWFFTRDGKLKDFVICDSLGQVHPKNREVRECLRQYLEIKNKLSKLVVK